MDGQEVDKSREQVRGLGEDAKGVKGGTGYREQRNKRDGRFTRISKK